MHMFFVVFFLQVPISCDDIQLQKKTSTAKKKQHDGWSTHEKGAFESSPWTLKCEWLEQGVFPEPDPWVVNISQVSSDPVPLAGWFIEGMKYYL